MTELVGKEFEFDVESSLDLVWEALTTPHGLATWYVHQAEVDLRPGGELKVGWGDGPHAMGTFDVVDAPNRLRLVYGGDLAGTEEWLLSHDNGVTHVRLIHSLPVEEDATWDDTYGDITRGWLLFYSTLQWAASTIGTLGRRQEIRIGQIADGAWDRVLSAVGVSETPHSRGTIAIDGLPPAEVLVGVDGYSLLLAFADIGTLLVDVEGSSLYTSSATYGDETDASAALRADIVSLAERLCAAAGSA